MTGVPGGFTLVEIMVVIVVLTILTATIVPEFSGTIEDARLRASGLNLAAAIRFAASEAVTRSRVLRLHVNPATGDYWLEAENERREFRPIQHDGRGRLDERIAVDVVPTRPVIMGGESETPPSPPPDEGGEAAAPPGVIRFYPDGTADGREIVLRSSAREEGDGLLLRLVVNPITSQVRASDSRESDFREGARP
jgi:prepilin-type N-terminal cleavage/methylation domain-containing protein